MRLYFYGLIMLIKKFLLRQSTGKVVRDFASKMGVVYVKLAQILAMQNIGQMFTEADRVALSQLCDHCKPVSYRRIRRILKRTYGEKGLAQFQEISPEPIGSASISQVHRAVLQDGSVVAIKVKRRDITRRIARQVRQMRRLVHRFGRMAKFANFLGSDVALDLYLDWIYQETDFDSERQNIVRYSEFAESVNQKVAHTHNIVVPKVHPELCTPEIIVMDFVTAPTLNRLPLTPENKERIGQGINDYLKLSFYALFHDLPVVFHGDPHGGNVYLDTAGNIGFLDLGLIFELSPSEASFVRQLFLNAYSSNVEKLVELIISHSDFTQFDRAALTAAIAKCCQEFRQIPVTEYFMKMIGVFTQHNIAPPQILFKMAKAFVTLFGINTFVGNALDTEGLLTTQVAEFYVERTLRDVRRVVYSGWQIVPQLVTTTLSDGPTKGLAESLVGLGRLSGEVSQLAENCGELLRCFKV